MKFKWLFLIFAGTSLVITSGCATGPTSTSEVNATASQLNEQSKNTPSGDMSKFTTYGTGRTGAPGPKKN